LFNNSFDPYKIRKDFHCLNQNDKQKPIYLDNACMTLKPDTVVDEIIDYYKNHPACHNRALHEFGKITTEKVEATRKNISRYLNCKSGSESIVFTKNTTESINMIANMMSFEEGDIILTTDLEHNSNILPWQFLSVKKRITFKQVSVNPETTEFNFEEFENVLRTNKVKLVSLFQISNITGIALPIQEITKMAHRYGALVLLDAAQSLSHVKIDVQELDVDFMALSIHKSFGPTGMGLLYGKKNLLENFTPFYVGGEGVTDTNYDSCVLERSPERFEVGLQNYAGIIGAGAAIKYLSNINLKKAHSHIVELNQSLADQLKIANEVSVIGPENAHDRNGILNLKILDKDPYEIAMFLSKKSRIMVRSGVHCGHSWYHKYELAPSLRISFSIYNIKEEVDIVSRDIINFIKN
jgi:cysteine desulfurase / selenocysteine lyase